MDGLVLDADIVRAAPIGLIILPFVAMLCGTGTDISNHQPTRRVFILGLGLSQAIFAIETEACGLLAKSLDRKSVV